jgi:hypothetical protein
MEQRRGSCTAGYCHTEPLMLDSKSALRGKSGTWAGFLPLRGVACRSGKS